jgi:phosphoesterase RecJ-like protein
LLLTRVESYDEQRVLLTWQNYTDYEEGATKLRVTEDLYRILQAIRNNEVVVFIKEKSAGECSVSLRSTRDFNVAKLANSLGGGGHHHAAGLNTTGTVAEVKSKILQELSRFFTLDR